MLYGEDGLQLSFGGMYSGGPLGTFRSSSGVGVADAQAHEESIPLGLGSRNVP